MIDHDSRNVDPETILRTRLRQLAEADASGDAEPYGWAPSRRRSFRAGFAAAAAVAIVAVGLVGAFSVRGDSEAPIAVADSTTSASGPVDPTTSTTATSQTSTTSSLPTDVGQIDIPPGKVPVASHEGGIAGFVDAEAEGSPNGYPVLQLGTNRTVKGLEVTDASGQLVGYFLEAYGFVDLETAMTPGAIDDLYADMEPMTPDQEE